MATIKDVAQRAGVSVATVSNYINGTKPVSRGTAAKIREAVEMLQYNPNQSAKALKTSVYNDVGVILPNLNDSYYVQIYQGIESAFRNSPYYLNLSFSYDIPELERKIADSMLRKQVSGLIVITCQPDSWKYYYENFIKKSRPLVLIDRAIQSLDASIIRFDSRPLIYEITHHLLQHGMKDIRLLSGPEKFSCEAACVQGFLDAYFDVYGIDASDNVRRIDLSKEDAFRRTTGLFRKGVPDAVLTTSELSATGVTEALHVLGYDRYQVPVVTLGEEHWNKHTHTMTSCSVERPAIRIGTGAAQMLLDRIRSPQTHDSEEQIIGADICDAVQKLHETLFSATNPKRTVSRHQLRILMLDTPAVHAFCRLLKNFESSTGVTTHVDLRPHNALYDTIMEAQKTDNYDVFMYDLPWLQQLAVKGILQDITDHLPQLGSESFLPGSMEHYGKSGGKYYGVPLIYAPQMLYYRRNLFEDTALCAKFEKQYGTPLKPPRTFTEFNTVASFFTCETDAIPYGISVPAAYSECLAPELYMRLRAFGSEVIDSRGQVVIDNPNALKAYINLVRALRYAKPDYMQATDVTIVDDFLRGETAMLLSYPGFMPDVSDLRKNNRIGAIGCTYIPGRTPLLGGWGLGIRNGCSVQTAALAFLKWVCMDEVANYFSMLGGYSAVSSTYTNDELVNLYPWLPLYKTVYPVARPMLPNLQTVSPNDIDVVVCKWLYRLIDEELEIEQVLKSTQAELEALLGKN